MDDQDRTGRGARQVFDDHLELRKRGDLEQNLARNYAPDVVVLTARGVLRGHDGVRESAALRYQVIRNANRYEYENAQCEDRCGCWSGAPRDGPAPSATASTPTCRARPDRRPDDPLHGGVPRAQRHRPGWW